MKASTPNMLRTVQKVKRCRLAVVRALKSARRISVASDRKT